MEDDADRDTAGGQLAEDGGAEQLVARVHGAGWFIGEEDAAAAGFVLHERSGQGGSLLLPCGEIREAVVGAVGEFEACEGAVDGGVALAGRAGAGDDAERDVLRDAEAHDDGGALRHIDEPSASFRGGERGDVCPIDLDAAGGGLEHAEQDFEQRRFAAAIGPDDRQNLARTHVEVDAIEDRTGRASVAEAQCCANQTRHILIVRVCVLCGFRVRTFLILVVIHVLVHNMPHTIAIAGATGFVGRYCARELLNRGHSVRALVRSRDKARQVLPHSPSLTLVQGEATDPVAAAQACEGATAVVNAVGIIREQHGNTFQRAHIDTQRALIAAARASQQAKRFILISALGVQDEGRSKYQTTKFEGEKLLRASDLEWTILRPSIVHGLGSDFLRMASQWVRGDAQPWLFLPYFTRGERISWAPGWGLKRIDPKVQPVAVEDVAVAVANCLEREASVGEIYNLVGPDTLTWPQMLEAIRDNVEGSDKGLRPVGIPAELAAIQAKAAKFVGLGGLLPFDEGMAMMGGDDNTATLDKARADLGFNPRPFLPTLKQYAGQL